MLDQSRKVGIEIVKDVVVLYAAELVFDPKVLGFCEAQFDYSPMEPNQIAFKVGERIAILSKSRGHRGWWKGRLDGKVSPIAVFVVFVTK